MTTPKMTRAFLNHVAECRECSSWPVDMCETGQRLRSAMTGRVFPRTKEGLERAMQWVAKFDPQTTLTLMGVSTFTVLRSE